MIKTILNFLIELGLIAGGLYFIINYKEEAKRMLSSESSLKIFGKVVIFHRLKKLDFMYPLAIIAGGSFLIVLGVLAFFHVVKIK